MPALALVLAVLIAPWAEARPQGDLRARGASELELAELRARDARLSFSPDSARRAAAALQGDADAALDATGRAMAVLALGCARASSELARIESALADGQALERPAALFALGELGQGGFAALEQCVARVPPGLEGALSTALFVAATRGVEAADERLESLAGRDDALGHGARSALRARAGEDPYRIRDALASYYELRWHAARTYGFVDGLRGSVAFAAELFEQREFQERVVWAAAAELSNAELRLHLSEVLRAFDGVGPEQASALRLALRVIPEELARACSSGVLRPSPELWRVLLAEIEAERLESSTKKLLELAFAEGGELEPRAGMLILRAGGDLPWKWVAEQLEHGSPAQRRALVEACGERDERASIPDLADLLERRADLGLFGSGLVALVRLGHAPSKTALEALVKSPASARRQEVLEALARVLHERALQRFAEEALSLADLTSGERLALQVGLVRGGASLARERVRAALVATRDPLERLACVRALAREAQPADVAVLAVLFPSGDELEDALELNSELALALLRQRHPALGGFLRAVLWGEDWNLSLLAGGLIQRAGGTRALLDELADAPPSASERDLRRVGFALGTWGGLGAVEELARTRSEGDPTLQGALLGGLAGRATERASEDLRPVPRASSSRAEPPARAELPAQPKFPSQAKPPAQSKSPAQAKPGGARRKRPGG